MEYRIRGITYHRDTAIVVLDAIGTNSTLTVTVFVGNKRGGAGYDRIVAILARDYTIVE